jgi:cytochrome c-type biogenesis protein CcmH/NrfF
MSDQQQAEPRAAAARGRLVRSLVAAAVLAACAASGCDREGRAPEAPPAASLEPVDAGPNPIVAAIPKPLSPEARILIERYRCVCGCNLALAVCTCSNTPGSKDMKALVQSLVEQEKSVEEIDRIMVETYGEQALLENPASE